MRYLICYRFTENGRWYIYNDCKEEKLQAAIENAFLVDGVVEVRVSKLPVQERMVNNAVD